MSHGHRYLILVCGFLQVILRLYQYFRVFFGDRMTDWKKTGHVLLHVPLQDSPGWAEGN
jgi:hypothetical protein